MKHKGERHIPDFSRASKPSRAAPSERGTQQPTPGRRPAQPKPRSTSAKSGRRGQ